ncbi:MAG: hypothetical protein IKV09_00660 [Alistipes sp.]|nr:hypothetical protein [Alistipes sp.]
MKLLHKITALAVALVALPTIVSAQMATPTAEVATTAIDMTAHIDEQTAEMLGENNTLALKGKISKIITRSGMVDSEGLFAVVPTIVVTDDGVVDTGMMQMRVLRADFTLSIVNLMDGTTFGSQTVAMQANGKDQATCLRQLVSRINVNDVRFVKLIKDSEQSIKDFYTRQMPILLKKIESMVAQEQYDNALAAMSMIPDCVEQYSQICDLKVEVYNKTLTNEVVRILAESELLVRQGKIDDALALCRKANPMSPNYKDILAFLNRLDAQAAAAEAAALEEARRRADAERTREKMLAAADVAGESIKTEMVAKEEAAQPSVNSSASKSTTSAPAKKKRKSLGQVLFGL